MASNSLQNPYAVSASLHQELPDQQLAFSQRLDACVAGIVLAIFTAVILLAFLGGLLLLFIDFANSALAPVEPLSTVTIVLVTCGIVTALSISLLMGLRAKSTVEKTYKAAGRLRSAKQKLQTEVAAARAAISGTNVQEPPSEIPETSP